MNTILGQETKFYKDGMEEQGTVGLGQPYRNTFEDVMHDQNGRTWNKGFALQEGFVDEKQTFKKSRTTLAVEHGAWRWRVLLHTCIQAEAGNPSSEEALIWFPALSREFGLDGTKYPMHLSSTPPADVRDSTQNS